jgi:hypothetical protein
VDIVWIAFSPIFRQGPLNKSEDTIAAPAAAAKKRPTAFRLPESIFRPVSAKARFLPATL